jgi:type II secretory pathway component PulF
MFTMVIPKISTILTESGQDIPIYTKIVLGISNFLVANGFIMLAVVIVVGFLVVRYIRTPSGTIVFDQFKLSIPYMSNLFRKLYWARLSDNMNTMLMSGIPMIRSLELTSSVINNSIYKKIIADAVDSVKAGKTVSEALSGNGEIPGIMIQMMRVGEESGEQGKNEREILMTLSPRVTAKEIMQLLSHNAQWKISGNTLRIPESILHSKAKGDGYLAELTKEVALLQKAKKKESA